jgi:hypothetical protein
MPMSTTRSACTVCGFTGAPTKTISGSFGVELLLWCFFLLPGMIYSIWRLSSKHPMCPSCGKDAMIPASTPAGAELVAARGGWSPAAEANYLATAKKEWIGTVVLAAFAWVWPIFWYLADLTTVAELCALLALLLTIRAATRYPLP